MAKPLVTLLMLWRVTTTDKRAKTRLMHFDPTFRDDRWTDELWRQAMVTLPLPAPGAYGRLRVVRQAAQSLPLFGRQLRFPPRLIGHWRMENATLWMSDTPQERLMMLQGTVGMAGHILVAGGGLGLYAQYLRRYRRAERVTIVECHPDVVTMLRATLGRDAAIEIVNESFAAFITQASGQRFDGCFIDIHPTLDPRWLSALNWLRDQCQTIVTGSLRIWGYQWMVRELVRGLAREYLPPLRRHCCFDDDLGRDLLQALPAGWEGWSAAGLHSWLTAYATQIAWPPTTDD